VEGQIGLEEHPNLWIQKMVEICGELRRVLKKTGSFYLNVGDTYYGSHGGTGTDLSKCKEVYVAPYEVTKLKHGKKSSWLQPKQLMLMPSRLAIALQDDGWILRNDIIWSKPNPMPSSVKDRLNTTYEHVFHFVKQRKYYYDLDSIREKHSNLTIERAKYPGNIQQKVFSKKGMEKLTSTCTPNPLGKNPGDVVQFKEGDIEKYNSKHIEQDSKFDVAKRLGAYRNKLRELGIPEYNPKGKNPGDVLKINGFDENGLCLGCGKSLSKHKQSKGSGMVLSSSKVSSRDGECYVPCNSLGKNPGDFWSITTQPFPEAHFAVYPEKLCIKPIKSSCPKQICKKCGFIRERIVERPQPPPEVRPNSSLPYDKRIAGFKYKEGIRYGSGQKVQNWLNKNPSKTLGFTKCNCEAGWRSGIVLDPFVGSGTTCLVAQKLGRNWIGIDIKKEYIEIAKKRLEPFMAEKLNRWS